MNKIKSVLLVGGKYSGTLIKEGLTRFGHGSGIIYGIKDEKFKPSEEPDKDGCLVLTCITPKEEKR